jgi:hypothetical protein
MGCIHLADSDAVAKLGVAGQKNQVGLEIDFQVGFTPLQGFPDPSKILALPMKPTGCPRCVSGSSLS